MPGPDGHWCDTVRLPTIELHHRLMRNTMSAGRQPHHIRAYLSGPAVYPHTALTSAPPSYRPRSGTF